LYKSPRVGDLRIISAKREKMKLRSSQLIMNDDGGIIMGKGRMEILDSIDRTGSINQTSKEMKMSYKTVWSKIKSTEKNFGKPVVHADRITGTRLTVEGRNLLEKYRQLKDSCMKADDAIFEDVFPS
jgi:molybdate transport system regulatory protein